MSKKIFRSIMTVSMIVLAACLFISAGSLYEYFSRSQASRLKEELSLVSAGVEAGGNSYLDSVSSRAFRFTLISNDGTVLYDSEADPKMMENHLDREEIKEAIDTGRGSSARYSSTLTEKTFYEATRLDNGNILRISETQMTLGALAVAMTPAICAVILFSTVTSLVLSQKMAKSIVKPLEMLDLDEPEKNDTYEELTPVLAKLKRQHSQITRQMKKMKENAEEFCQITASMDEGLIILGKDGCVLSINESAKKLFDTDDSAIGLDFSAVDRTPKAIKAVEEAMEGRHSEFCEGRHGGEYRFIVTPTVSDGKVSGTVILSIDITESAHAERRRREFTANVSHELKTPLQSIIGSAELLENGLVKAEDTDRFIRNIREEAERLVDMIADIIELSRLDGENEPERETVDLYETALEAVSEIASAADKKGIGISVEGSPCPVTGIKRYLYEILFNLCDNAVRYNKKGGNVTVTVKTENGVPTLTVSDTGIGIPRDHQDRIFERFYRVDKSHSKETGGTGLGLSIVKHAASLHKASVRLESTVGVGTTVTVSFDGECKG